MPKKNPLPEAIVRAGRRGQVDGEIGDRLVGRRHGAAGDAPHADVRREVSVRLLEQREREIELRLGDALLEVQVGSVGHAPSAIR